MDRLPQMLIIFYLTQLCFFGAVSSSCPAGQFLNNGVHCCYLCPPGSFMFRPCASPEIYPLCIHCLNGMYTDKPNMMKSCLPCHQCDTDSQYEERICDTKNNRKCSCRQGFHEYDGKCVIEESSTEEMDFYFELFSKILTCFEFSTIFMMAIFIVVLAVQRRFTKIVTDVDGSEVCFSAYDGFPQRSYLDINADHQLNKPPRFGSTEMHSLLSGMIGEEDTNNLEPEDETLLHAVYVHDDEQTEAKITEMKLNTLRTKYAVSPTLDLNSANPQIVISSDHWMASLSGFDQLYPEHPHRFTSCKQVLAKESFFSGRYYWEVDVTRAHNYEIGIAFESMLRRGGGWEYLLGWNANSWCVAKHDGKYTARHDGFETNLNMLGDPKHLGLCLDCDTGDLIFYAINDSFSWPMHTFYLDVKEPLRPVLRLCNIGDSLRFFSLQCYEDNHSGMLHL